MAAATTAIEDPARWGLAAGPVEAVAERLRAVWGRYRGCFATKTRESSELAWTYLRGVLTMAHERTFTNIARRIEGPETDGQRVQHFMSASPWSAQRVLEQLRAEVAATPALRHSGVLILDVSADVKPRTQTAGPPLHSTT